MRALVALPVAAALALLALAPAAARPTDDPTALSHGHVSSWAYVLRPVVSRETPRADAPVVTIVRPKTPERRPNLVQALMRGSDEVGGEWVKVRLAILPLGSTGWVRRRALGTLHVLRTHLVVDRARLTAVLYRNGVPVFRSPVGVGQPQWPTPRGRFYVRQLLSHFDDSFYGPLAFGTSARSPVLTDWPGGGFVGIHGTDRPELIPGRISHGCIRMRNADIRRLARLMPLGTPLTVV
jgi:hypothetical protein